LDIGPQKERAAPKDRSSKLPKAFKLFLNAFGGSFFLRSPRRLFGIARTAALWLAGRIVNIVGIIDVEELIADSLLHESMRANLYRLAFRKLDVTEGMSKRRTSAAIVKIIFAKPG
jgi:hypothetical protein